MERHSSMFSLLVCWRRDRQWPHFNIALHISSIGNLFVFGKVMPEIYHHDGYMYFKNAWKYSISECIQDQTLPSHPHQGCIIIFPMWLKNKNKHQRYCCSGLLTCACLEHRILGAQKLAMGGDILYTDKEASIPYHYALASRNKSDYTTLFIGVRGGRRQLLGTEILLQAQEVHRRTTSLGATWCQGLCETSLPEGGTSQKQWGSHLCHSQISGQSNQSGQHAHKFGANVEEKGKGITFLLSSFGANGNTKGGVSEIHQPHLAPDVRHSLPTLFLLPGQFSAPYDSPTSWKICTSPLGPVPPELETPSTSPSVPQCLIYYWLRNTLLFALLLP